MQFGHEVAIQKIVNNTTFVRVYAQFVEKVAPAFWAGSHNQASTHQPDAVESLFTVMEYVPGASLEELLETRLQQNQGPLPKGMPRLDGPDLNRPSARSCRRRHSP